MRRRTLGHNRSGRSLIQRVRLGGGKAQARRRRVPLRLRPAAGDGERSKRNARDWRMLPWRAARLAGARIRPTLTATREPSGPLRAAARVSAQGIMRASGKGLRPRVEGVSLLRLLVQNHTQKISLSSATGGHARRQPASRAFEWRLRNHQCHPAVARHQRATSAPCNTPARRISAPQNGTHSNAAVVVLPRFHLWL